MGPVPRELRPASQLGNGLLEAGILAKPFSVKFVFDNKHGDTIKNKENNA